MEEKKYLVSEVSKITGIPKETVRFYDKKGILKPSYVDPLNNYRYYTYEQFWCFDIILCLRRLGVPLKQIKEILNIGSNKIVLKALMEHRDEAIKLSKYYADVAEDIIWYYKQQEKIHEAKNNNEVVIKHFDERKVLFGENREDKRAYHLKLQELCYNMNQPLTSIRRKYGFIIEEECMLKNNFIKKGEYIQFEESSVDDIDEKHVTIIPEGKYACCIVCVYDDHADFSIMSKWLEKEKLTPKFVIADEIALQLFQYLPHGYLCELKVLID